MGRIIILSVHCIYSIFPQYIYTKGQKLYLSLSAMSHQSLPIQACDYITSDKPSSPCRRPANQSATRREEQAKIDAFVAAHPTWLPEAAEGIEKYQLYVEKLA